MRHPTNDVESGRWGGITPHGGRAALTLFPIEGEDAFGRWTRIHVLFKQGHPPTLCSSFPILCLSRLDGLIPCLGRLESSSIDQTGHLVVIISRSLARR